MSAEDDFTKKGQPTFKAADLQNSTSEAALAAAQGEVPQTPDIKKQVMDAYEGAAKRMRQAAYQEAPHPGSVYEQAGELAQSGYRVAGQQVASSPVASIAIATFIGVALGWAFRGAREEQRRADVIASLLDYWRRGG